MADLFLHGRPVQTVFDLLGDKENDITFSIGWALAQCNAFVDALLGILLPGVDVGEVQAIQLQQAGVSGFTDIEIITNHTHVIIEAKRGWNMPDEIEQQITKYASRFSEEPGHSLLVVMSEGTSYYATPRLPQKIMTTPVQYLSWNDVALIAAGCQRNTNHAGKRLLKELMHYLSNIMTSQNQTSNQVYVVALAGGQPSWSRLSWRNIVAEQRRYFHPVGGNGWPKLPPNYVGFRYGGKLQSIHHVDKYVVVADKAAMAAGFPQMPSASWDSEEAFADAHFLYTLGTAIVPVHEVLTGNIYPSGRVWVALDLLLTSQTIYDARNLTQQRMI